MYLTTGAAPLLGAADGERALAVAETVFARGLRWTQAHAEWAPESIGMFGGCVLVAAALVRAGRAPAASLHDLVRSALVSSPERRGLYQGRAGLLVVLDTLDPEGSAFARPRAALRAAIAADVLQTRALDPGARDDYDLINGVAGKLIALREVPNDVAAHARELFAGFADRVEARLAAPEAGPAQEPLDLGVAHGVPGVLAALNLALPGERAQARRYVELILASSHVRDGVRRWDSSWERARFPAPRRAWCYQTAGVAAVLHDRALLDGDEGLRALALDALEHTLHEPEPPLWDEGLCHGRSGVALIYARLAGERFAQAARELAREVLNRYDDDAPFGYRPINLVLRAPEDRPQFLDAGLGIAMFLIEAARPSERRWLPLLGLLPDGAAV